MLGSGPLSKQAVVQDRYDGEIYGELLEASAELRSLASLHDDPWPSLPQDVWAIYYKAAPELETAENMAPGYALNRSLAERVLEDPETAQARVSTRLDETAAAMATITTARKLVEAFRANDDLQKALEEAQRQAASNNGDGNSDGDHRDGQNSAPDVAGQGPSLDELLQAGARSVRRAVREAVQAGKDEAEKLHRVLLAWGLTPADLKRVPLGQRLDFAKRLTTPDMVRIAEAVGRMKYLARAKQRARIRRGKDEIHSITLGADLGHVLPAELVALGHPLRRLDFYRRFTERQLLQYDLRSKERVGKGPIVLLLDASGSMRERMDTAVALAMALVDTAARHGRWCRVIPFNAKVLPSITWAPKERDVNKILKLASIGAEGGTNYWPAFQAALRTLRELPFENADVVLVTDGICRLQDTEVAELADHKRASGFRIWTILVNQRDPSTTAQWSDRVWWAPTLEECVDTDFFEVLI